MPVAMKRVRVQTGGAGINLDIDGLDAFNTGKVRNPTGDAPIDPAATPDALERAEAKREMVISIIGGLISALVVGGAGILWSWLL